MSAHLHRYPIPPFDFTTTPEEREAEANCQHNLAMSHADAAVAARRAGDHTRARDAFHAAAKAECRAAALTRTQPWRAILHRSAAQLALDAGDPTEAARLAAAGLAGPETPPGLAAELRQIATEAARLLTPAEPTPMLNLQEWTSTSTGWRYRFELMNAAAPATHITSAIVATVRAIALPGESFEDVRVGLDRPVGEPEAVTVDDLPAVDLAPLYREIVGQTPALASLTKGDALALYYIAEAYHSDPWTVATWEPERLGFAIACLQAARKAEAEADCADNATERPALPVTVDRTADTLSITTTAAAVDRLRDLVNSYGLPPAPIDAHLIANGLAVAMHDTEDGYTRKTQAGAALVVLWQGATP